MCSSGDRSLGLAGVRPWAGDIMRAPRVRVRVNKRFLANTLRGVISANARVDAKAKRQILSRAEGERPGGAVADEAAAGKKRCRDGDDAAGKHAVDDPSANRESNPAATGFPRDVDSDIKKKKRRRGGGSAPTTEGHALIPEPASAAGDLRDLLQKKKKKKKKAEKKQKAEKKAEKKSKSKSQFKTRG